MIRISKSNITLCVILIFITIFCFNAEIYMKSALAGIYVWANNVLPALFPFFIFTRIIVALNANLNLDFLTKKCFNAPNGSGNIYALSILSGYPVGARMISQYHNMGYINDGQATQMLSYCSTSGPVFMMGTVGIGMLKSNSAGLIIFLAHTIGSFLNGLLFRGKKVFDQTGQKALYIGNNQNAIIYDSVYDSVVSILLVGGYIVISFVIIDILNNLNILPFLANCFNKLFFVQNKDLVLSIFNGLIEMTRGCLDISNLNISIQIKTIICCGLISFSGLCVFLQSLAFLTKIKIKKSKLILMKITQSIFSMIVCIFIVLLL